jgi:4-amino-4-deoxy-L-arabinose transferase-like glycosyltransferase
MVQENDFLSLWKGHTEYLDKPHMHFWLAAISFKIFGIHDWAYRIPAILASFLAACSCYGLGKLFYNKNAGKLAALIFLTSQTIVIANIDVRTDQVLAAFTIFSIWQLAAYIEKGKLQNILLGAFGAGMAFSTKGQIALVVIGIAMLSHLLYTGEWKALLNWKVLAALLVFGITISPMLYAYYQQFDLHPEKVIRGRSDRSGIFFIFWEQSFERLTGDGLGSQKGEFFFFFHTYFWAFLPWCIAGIMAIRSRITELFQTKFNYRKDIEILTLGTIGVVFILISFSQHKLPHYLNILIPLFSLITAGYLEKAAREDRQKEVRFLYPFQVFIMGGVFLVCLLQCFYVYKVSNIIIGILIFSGILAGIFYAVKGQIKIIRLITLSVLASVLLNLVMNLYFYPRSFDYQAGNNMAEIIKREEIPVERIFKVSRKWTWALDFYIGKPIEFTTPAALEEMKDVWVYLSEEDMELLQEYGLTWSKMYTVDQFRITRMRGKFYNPDTREQVLRKRHLVYLN